MMMFRGPRVRIVAVLAALMAAAALPGWAQTYPSRPVQLVVGYAQGGTGDFVARLLAEKLTAVLGQPVGVENRPGASGTAAAQGVARAAPDGHTLLIGQPGEISINPMLMKDLGYDPARDLQPVALAAVSPLALVVQSTAPYSTVGEMTAASLSSPRGLSFASPVQEPLGTSLSNCSARGPGAGSTTCPSKAVAQPWTPSSPAKSTCTSPSCPRRCRM